MIALDSIELAQETGIAGISPADDLYGLPLGVYNPLLVEPETVEEVSRVLALANARGLKVVPVGSGTKQDRGTPPTACDIVLHMGRISGVIEHASGDMTVSVRAGTSLADLQSEIARAGQFLAIDPPVPGTVGGSIATGDSGPRRLRYGGLRDMLLGVTFVRADGTVAHAGGKVVKNVAGYDLPKLLTGSLGTLGVIVEATFRLYPIPAASATIVSKNISVTEAASLSARLLTSGLVPTIVDYYADRNEAALAARFETSPRSVHGQAESALSMLGEREKLEDDAERELWAVFDSIARTGETDVLARLISIPSELPRLLERTRQHAEELGINLTVRAHMYGHALIRLNESDNSTALQFLRYARAQAESHQSNLVIWRAPGAVREQIDVWGDPGEGLPLMRRVKAQFDPKGTLNPGRFVGGI
jgi:glycolate oxidase FAD binding subunit